MAYAFPPELDVLVKQRISSGVYSTEDEVLLDAMRALALMEQRRNELRAELGERVREIEAGLVEPFDRDAFLQQMR